MKAKHDNEKWPNRTLHFCFPLKSSIYILVIFFFFLRKGCLSFTTDCNNCRWLIKKKKKMVWTNLIIVKKWWKVLISVLKPLDFLGAMTTMTITTKISPSGWSWKYQGNITAVWWLWSLKVFQLISSSLWLDNKSLENLSTLSNRRNSLPVVSVKIVCKFCFCDQRILPKDRQKSQNQYK